MTSLRQLGLHRSTDLIGGFQAWRAAGLPVTLAADAETAADADAEGRTGTGTGG
ncbi:Sulfurtransferase OS=Streptomyces microflavus OX=1919 GN=Smic_62500 PE=4 SV=1 [Streptomyces microflavus]